MSMLARVLVIIAIIGALFGAHLAYSSHYVAAGRTMQLADDEAQKAADNKAAEKKIADANTRAKAAGDLLAAKTTEYETNRVTENANHEKALKVERARALAGASELRCPANTANRGDTAGSGTDRSVTGRPGAEAGTNLVPGAADSILGIASDSAKLVRDYNQIVDLYNDARTACMTGR